MAGAFASGFGMGQRAYQQALDNDRQTEEDARRKVLEGRVDQEWDRQQAQRQLEEQAFQNYGAVRQGMYDGSQGLDFGQMPDASAGPMPMGVQRIPTVPSAGAAPARRDATRGELNNAQFHVALARRDTGTMAALDRDRQGIREDELLANAAITPESIRWVNNTHPRFTIKPLMKGGKETGYTISDITPEGDAVETRLSMADAKRLAGGIALMQMNPTRAYEIISGIDGKLAESLARENGVRTQSAQANNSAVRYANSDAGDAETRAEISRHNTAMESDSRARLGLARASANKPNYIQLVDSNGDAQMVDASKLPSQRGVLQFPQGMRFPRQAPELKVNPDGSVIRGSDLYTPDPKSPGGYKRVELGATQLDQNLLEMKRQQEKKAAAVLDRRPSIATSEDFTSGNRPAWMEVDPRNVERRSTRGFFGGVTYELVDRVSDQKLTLDQYNQLTERR